ERGRRNPRLAGQGGDRQPDLVLEAPGPVLSGLERADQSVSARRRVGGGVAVRRAVAAPDVTAAQADPQVQPGIAALQAVLAALDRLRPLPALALIEVRA